MAERSTARERGDALTQILRNAERLEQVVPDATADHHAWFCNGCTFETHSIDKAMDHAIEEHFPFQHILYEREKRGAKKALRRIHGEGGKVVRVMKPKGRA